MSVATPNDRSNVNARRATAELATSRTTETRPRPWIRSAPAVWKSADSSASRSHSRRGAIAASSFRRSSLSGIAFEREQPALVLDTARPVGAETRRRDDAVARHEDRQRVVRAERPRGARGPGPAGKRRQLPVGDHLSARHGAQRASELVLERSPVDVELHVVERHVLAG